MTRSRILVVDDERIVSLDIQGALVRLGYEIAGAATTGQEALRLALSAAPDLVLMDIRLDGGMDGADAALAISQAADVPVVFLTAYSDERTMLRALSAAPFGYLIKPFEDRELRGVIELALAKHRAERDHKRARRAAEAADQAKTVFLGTLSHELRTPMNGILGMTELLLLSELSDEQRENLERLKTCAQGMTETLNQLLEYSSLEKAPFDPGLEQYSPGRFLEEAAEVHAPRARAKGLEFRLEAGPLPELALGSPARLRQALDQLLKNAVDYCDKGSVTLSAMVDEPRGGPRLLRLTVADTGPGLDAEQLPRLFESFTQAEDYLTRRRGGLGLGLAACRRVAESLGGGVEAVSAPGRGSAFTLTAPLRLVRAAAGDPALAGVLVLVAQGARQDCPQLPAVFEAAGATPVPVSGGAAAARALCSRRVDAAVFCPGLPVEESLALARMVREGRTLAASSAPLGAVLPAGAGHERERCLMAGMDAVQTDPADLPGLAERLGELARRARSAAEFQTIHRQGADA